LPDQSGRGSSVAGIPAAQRPPDEVIQVMVSGDSIWCRIIIIIVVLVVVLVVVVVKVYLNDAIARTPRARS